MLVHALLLLFPVLPLSFLCPGLLLRHQGVGGVEPNAASLSRQLVQGTMQMHMQAGK